MGLSSFNRSRREKAKVEKIEAERFKADNEARHKARYDKEAARKVDEELQEKARAAEVKATEAIGKKVRAGLENDDLPLRKDHAAEIAGRDLDDVQEPKDPVKRIAERIPSGTENEKLVAQLSAEADGPSPAQVQAAREEAGAVEKPKRGRKPATE